MVENRELSKDVKDYLNGYPAFSEEVCHGCVIEPEFFGNVFRHHVVDAVKHGTDPKPEDLESAGMTLDEFNQYVRPAIMTCWYMGDRRVKIDMKMAEMLLRYIEPLWCTYMQIDSTGYVRRNSRLMTAAELLDDDMMDI